MITQNEHNPDEGLKKDVLCAFTEDKRHVVGFTSKKVLNWFTLLRA